MRRGLARSREDARDLVARHEVLVCGAIADKPGRMVALTDPVVVTARTRRFVSRAGDKLAAALDRFGVDPAGRRCLDAGASTGGFTDCLVQRGASYVVAVDVGYGQLAPELRHDEHVRVMERTNVRSLELRDVGGVAFDLVVADLSFISLTTVAPVLAGSLAAPGADLVTLVKPQFEAGRAAASRGRGVIRDAEGRRAALGRVASAFEAAGAVIMGAMASPLLGPAGNAEFFLHGRAHAAPALSSPDAATATMIDDAVEGAPDATPTPTSDAR